MWAAENQGHLYNSDAAWAAVWTGEGLPPDTPFGRPVPVFNTSYTKARKCADTYNAYLREKD